jgi:hypothetical protein
MSAERVRCAYIFPSRRRCSNTATNAPWCRKHDPTTEHGGER